MEKMDKYLEIGNLPKLNQEESENLNRQITPNIIEALKKKKGLWEDGSKIGGSRIHFTLRAGETPS